MRKQFVHTVTDVFAEDQNAVLILGDIGVYGFSALIADFPDRAFNIGILEQATIGMAAGLSMEGFCPIVHTIAPFIVERSLEQLKIDFGYQRLRGNFVSVGGAYDYASLGPTHHCPADFEVLKSIPNFQLFCPGSAEEFDHLFKFFYDSGAVNYFRLSEKKHSHGELADPGKGLPIKPGRKALVIAIGSLLSDVLLAVEGLDVSVLYINCLSPIDYDLILDSFEKIDTNKIIIVEPAYEGTTASILLKYLSGLSVNLSSIGVPRRFIDKYGNAVEIDDYLDLDLESIARRIREVLS